MAQTAVDIVVKTLGTSKLVQLDKNLKRIDQTAKNSSRNIDGVSRAVQGLGRAIAGVAIGGFFKQAAQNAAGLASTELRLKQLAGSTEEYAKALKLVEQNAKTFNQSQVEASSNFADIYARLRPLGKSLEEIQTIYQGFNAVAITSGTSAQAASGAFLQLSQALGSGVLQGDEFRSIAEQVPGILKLIADEMGVSVGALKKLGSEGKLTADILVNALAKGFELNKDKIQEIIDQSPSQKFKAFGNAVSDLSTVVGQELLPVLTPIVEGLTNLVKAAADLPGPIKTAAISVGVLAVALGGLNLALGTLNISLFGFIGTLGGKLITALAMAGGGATTMASKFTVAGAGIAKTTVAIKASTVALGALKAGIIGLPLVLLAQQIYKVWNEQKEWNKFLREAPVKELEGKAKELREELKLVEPQLGKVASASDMMSGSFNTAARQADILKGKLEELRIAAYDASQGADLDMNAIYNMPGGKNNPIKRDKPTPTPTPTFSSGSLGSSGPSGPSAEDILRDQLKAGEEIERTLYRQGELKRTNDKYDKDLLQNAYDLDDTIRSIYETAAPSQRNGLIATATENARLDEMIIKAKQFGEAMGKDLAGTLPEVNNELSETDKLLKGAFDTVANGLTNGIKGLIDGTKSWRDVLSDITGQLGSMLLQMGTKALGVGLGVPGFADGGRPMVGNVALVGEAGPELVKFDQPAQVYSNEQSQAAMATYSPANESGGGSNVTMSFQTTQFMDREWIDREQLESAMARTRVEATAAGAKAGEQRAMNRLRQSRSTRNRLGM